MSERERVHSLREHEVIPPERRGDACLSRLAVPAMVCGALALLIGRRR